MGRNYKGLAVMILLSFVAVLSQFTSTILISDTAETLIIGKMEDVVLPYALKGDPNAPRKLSAFDSEPTAFPRFAEMMAMMTVTDNATGQYIVDTGPTVRALLLLKSQANRSSLINYRGMATLVDSHVLCVSPIIDEYRYNNSSSLLEGTVSAPLLYAAFNSGGLQKRGLFEGEPFNPATKFHFSCYLDFYLPGPWHPALSSG